MMRAAAAVPSTGGGHGGGGTMSGCGCHHEAPPFDGQDRRFRRTLLLVAALNGGMFVVEMLAGAAAGSRALQADALDFLGDGLTYAMSLWAIGRPLRTRAGAAILKGASLSLMGLWVLGSTLWQVLVLGLPRAEIMGVVGFLALATNLLAVVLLMRWRDGDANVRSVWLCSRNDAIGNLAVIAAAAAVAATGTAWPDLLVAAAMAGLFLHSSTRILLQARGELARAAASAGARA
jgi:Co/Zn/Cd efflux system component